MTAIPWGNSSTENLSNEDHCGLEDAKKRILEFIAVQKYTKRMEAMNIPAEVKEVIEEKLNELRWGFIFHAHHFTVYYFLTDRAVVELYQTL